MIIITDVRDDANAGDDVVKALVDDHWQLRDFLDDTFGDCLAPDTGQELARGEVEEQVNGKVGLIMKKSKIRRRKRFFLS